MGTFAPAGRVHAELHVIFAESSSAERALRDRRRPTFVDPAEAHPVVFENGCLILSMGQEIVDLGATLLVSADGLVAFFIVRVDFTKRTPTVLASLMGIALALRKYAAQLAG